MVYRIYVEKKPGLSPEAESLLGDLRGFLGIENLTGLRILNRYDVDQIDRDVYERARGVVFSEPQVDMTYDETFPEPDLVLQRYVPALTLPGKLFIDIFIKPKVGHIVCAPDPFSDMLLHAVFQSFRLCLSNIAVYIHRLHLHMICSA